MALIGRRIFALPFERSKPVIICKLCSTKNVPDEALDRNPKDDEFKPIRLMRWEAYVRQEKENIRNRKPGLRFGSDLDEILPPRSTRMAVDQHWPSVWPVAASFRESVVPLPLYQGYRNEGKLIPGKVGNLELMKVPNFFHLTPPAVKAQCAAIKKFCTAFPEELKKERSAFPLNVITTDYCYSGPTIREPKARVVTLKVKLADLRLDAKSEDKMKRLLEHRFDKETDTITITTDRCPMRKQNYDYAKYLLTALYHECQKEHPWENEKNEDDWLFFKWEGSRTLSRVRKILQIQNSEENLDALMSQQSVGSFAEHFTQLKNSGESEENIASYKESLLKVLQLQPMPAAVE